LLPPLRSRLSRHILPPVRYSTTGHCGPSTLKRSLCRKANKTVDLRRENINETTTFDQLLEQHHAVSRDSLARAIWSTIIEPGDKNAGQLIATLSAAGALEAVLTSEDAELQFIRERVIHRFSGGAVELAFRSAARFGAELVTPEHPHWPIRINDLGHSAPVALWVRGNTEYLVDEASIAIVGARAATGYGEHVTMEITSGLVERGHTIVSGGAYGIDGMAHRAALASTGRTVAYLAVTSRIVV
jgi:DNA processing protein